MIRARHELPVISTGSSDSPIRFPLMIMFLAVRPLARGSADPILRLLGGGRRAAGSSGEISLFIVHVLCIAHFYDMLLYVWVLYTYYSWLRRHSQEEPP